MNEKTDAQHLSRRGIALTQQPPFAEYILAHFERSEQPWDPETRPEGYVALCIAENRLMWSEFSDRLGSISDVPARSLGYDSMIGALPVREQLAAFMSRSIFGREVTAEQLAMVAGAGSVLELAFHALADPGDAVLVPTPSYAGFWADLQTRDELTVVPVARSETDGWRLTTTALDAAIASSERTVRALLFTTPDNPLGRIAPREEVLEILAWAETRDIHVVFDEIYALSVFGPDPFTSVASMREQLGPRVHVVWAFSKDFGASGLRCGVLFSENGALIQAVDALAYWAACSGDTQYRLGALVSDREWVDGYIEQMRSRLADAYRETTQALDVMGVPYVAADGGIFVLADLRAFLPEATWAAEDALWRRILDDANVNLTPGSACRTSEPGYFRVCYAAEPREAVRAALARVARVLGAAPTR